MWVDMVFSFMMMMMKQRYSVKIVLRDDWIVSEILHKPKTALA